MYVSLTPAAQVILALIPIVGVTFAAILFFFVLLWHHHENKLRIIKGIDAAPKQVTPRAFFLLSGMCLMAVGSVLTFMFILLSGATWALMVGLIPLSLGIILLVFYKINPDFKQPIQDNEK